MASWSCAFPCSTAAAAESYWPWASSRSFCDSAFCSASGLVRARFALATSSDAWLRASAACCASTCAWNGFWSIWNSTWPALTTEPSTYMRLSRNPDTRAWMLTACELCVCATKVAVTGVSRGATVSTVTSTGGRSAVFFSSLPQPASKASDATNAAASTRKASARARRRSAEFMGGYSGRKEAGNDRSRGDLRSRPRQPAFVPHRPVFVDLTGGRVRTPAPA